MTQLLTRFDAPDIASAERFAQRLSMVERTVGNEPGFVDYAVFRAHEDPTILFVLETWRTRADAERHIATATQSKDGREALGLLLEPPETFTLIPTGLSAGDPR